MKQQHKYLTIFISTLVDEKSEAYSVGPKPHHIELKLEVSSCDSPTHACIGPYHSHCFPTDKGCVCD